MTAIFCEGSKVYLRVVQPEDVPLIVKWKSDPLVRRMALGPEVQITSENQENDIRRAIESGKELYLIIVVEETDQAIGYVRINWIDETKRFAWLRFALGEQRRRGYAKDALKALLAHLFVGEAHRVEAEVYEFNEPSFNLLESLGFKREGIKRKAHFDGERYTDMVILGLLKEEFRSASTYDCNQLYGGTTEAAEFETQLGSARCLIRRIAQEFNLAYREKAYSFLFVSKRESCLRNYLAAPIYAEFGTTLEERVHNLEKFLDSPLYAEMTVPGSTHGCVLTREELDEERKVIPKIPDPGLRGEFEALYRRLEQQLRGRCLTMLSRPETEGEQQRGLEYLILHEWLHVLLWDNDINFQSRDKSWEWDEGLVTYLMAFLGKEELDATTRESRDQGTLTKLHRKYLEAGRRWQAILQDKRTPAERKAVILEQLEA